jgi:phosphinothricin acetyltransferase
MRPMSPTIRLATSADLLAINDIYNHYVLHCTCTYQTEPETLADREKWFGEHSPDRYPVIVAEIADYGTPQRAFPATPGRVVGWGSLSKFRPRAAYAPTAEPSVYIHHDYLGRGLGRLLLVDLIARAKAAGFHSLIGGASADRPASLALQESLGFVRVAHLKEVGYKFGRWLDVVYMQLMLEQPTSGS